MKKLIYAIILTLLILTSCKRDKFDIDISHIDLKLNIVRFDTMFCEIGFADSIFKFLPQWTKQYPDFWEIYSQMLMGFGSPMEYIFVERVNQFYDYCDKYHIYTDVLKVFPKNDNYLQQVLTPAFKRYKYYFPDRTIPDIYTVISGFQVSVFTGDSLIGISLDKYLGANYPLYRNLGFELYKRRRMIKEMIPVDVMRAWAIAEFPFNDSVNNLLAHMIYEGRIQYFLDAMLPNYPDTLKWGYTLMQWKWANMYEKNIWDYFIERKLLFSQKNIDIKTFTGDAPFTTPFHRNSAPRAGTFIGYKIVKSFMENHPEITLEQLMKITDYIMIYNESYYEP